eukprot:1392897-Karenia_brevis.AAC.1
MISSSKGILHAGPLWPWLALFGLACLIGWEHLVILWVIVMTREGGLVQSLLGSSFVSGTEPLVERSSYPAYTMPLVVLNAADKAAALAQGQADL